ncbi:MAG TPA: hypothetical protein VKA91_03575 [Nitrososphaeraceae archaeon]|nr:hypothetical protein [Nitrososphaeraceae archaeon]
MPLRGLGYWFALPKLSLLLFIILSLGVQAYAVNTLTITKSPFESGYGHGCDDAGITDFSDRYINQPGKGPSFHTEEFMRGYDTGYNACSNAMQ